MYHRYQRYYKPWGRRAMLAGEALYKYGPRYVAGGLAIGGPAYYMKKKHTNIKGKYPKNQKSKNNKGKPYVKMSRKRLVLPKSKITKLDDKVSELAKLAESDIGTLTYRRSGTSIQESSANLNTNLWYVLNDTTGIEQAIAQLRYYDPTAPSSLVTADFSTGSYHKEVLVDYSSVSLRIRANYTIPCHVDVYSVICKNDTNYTPLSAMSDGIANISNATSTSLYVYPSDIPLFRDLFKIESCLKCDLKPGQSKVFKIDTPEGYKYDPSITDDHNLVLQKKNKARGLLVRVRGLIAHDSAVADQVGYQEGVVDTEAVWTYKMKYNAGADIDYIYVNSGLDTFTTGADVCNENEAKTQQKAL